MEKELEIRECTALEELTECVQIQREVFGLPENELSPVRHLVVTINAGGFVIGAFDGSRLAGFVLSVAAFLRGAKALYSHMTAVRAEYQSLGIGAKLKWAQRSRALSKGVDFIKWTFEPMKARNAYFNLEKLGVVVREYKANFYGTDYPGINKVGMPTDRLFAEWYLHSAKVEALAAGNDFLEDQKPISGIEIVNNWPEMIATLPAEAIAEQTRIREKFEAAFARGQIARGFSRDEESPAYLLYEGDTSGQSES